MRSDQFEDKRLFEFSDSSKLRTAKVELDWSHDELYGLLFQEIKKQISKNGSAIENLPELASDGKDIMDTSWYRPVFERIAGQFMGRNRRRGYTYTWLPKHLADTADQASPRSFLVAAQKAAEAATQETQTPIDYKGINEGVREASESRVAELREDYPWISIALDDLKGLTVPCPPDEFIGRWRERGTVNKIENIATQYVPNVPVTFEPENRDNELALLEALKTLRVVEYRESTGKVNVPDVYRVGAGLGRRGGVPPGARRRTR